jgi:hypothetical protein
LNNFVIADKKEVIAKYAGRKQLQRISNCLQQRLEQRVGFFFAANHLPDLRIC